MLEKLTADFAYAVLIDERTPTPRSERVDATMTSRELLEAWFAIASTGWAPTTIPEDVVIELG